MLFVKTRTYSKPAVRTLIILMLSALVTGLAFAAPANASGGPTFVDPTARISGGSSVALGNLVYVGPFARLKANSRSANTITIGNESNVQDSATLDASAGPIVLGEQVIIAHGATVLGNSQIGVTGECPTAPTSVAPEAHCPSFVSFNAEVDGAIIQRDAMVQALSRVGPGVTIPSGYKTKLGVNITSQAEVSSKTEPVVDTDREFMAGVIHVNIAFAEEYAALAQANPTSVQGVNKDPDTAFNPGEDVPVLGGVATIAPGFRNRIIGDLVMADSLEALDEVMGAHISLRADEGDGWEIGTVAAMGNHITFHALEHTHLHLGDEGVYGQRSIVHGGATDFNGNKSTSDHGENETISGDNFVLGSESVFFRSHAGDNVTIGNRSLVVGTVLGAGADVRSNTVIVGGQRYGAVEW